MDSTNIAERLYIGNGILSGGKVVGNLYKGSSPTITDLYAYGLESGDIGFETDSSSLFVLLSGSGISVDNWKKIGGVYSSGDSYIDIDSSNVITLNALSAYSLSNDLVSSPISINSGKLVLLPLSSGHISSNSVKGPIIVDSGQITLSAKIPFTSVSTKQITVSSGLRGFADGVEITNTATNPLSSNIVIKSNRIIAKYNGLSSTPDYSQNLSSVVKLSAGTYKFIYPNVTPPNLVPQISLYGGDTYSINARVTSLDLSSCEVRLLSSGVSVDSTIFLTIDY